MNPTKTISHDEYKQMLLDLLTHFHLLCQKHGMTYFLDSGTLLGAVRHKGYIPWDDDIDVSMPREDYERLFKEFDSWQHAKHLRLYDYRKDKDYHFPFMKLNDERTVMKFARMNKQVLGVNIDIFPFDGVPANPIARYIHVKTANLLQRCQSLANRTRWRVKKFSFAELMLRAVFHILTMGASPQFFCKLQEKWVKRYCPSKAPFRANLVWCSYRHPSRYCIPSAAYAQAVSVPFEGRDYNAPVGYDAYLRMCYGEYMTPLPPEKRTNVHYFGAWWKNDLEEKDFSKGH